MMQTYANGLAAVAAATLLFAGSASASAPEVGAAAPSFTAVDTKGETVDLAAYRGKTVVLEWTNHDCPFVVKHYGSGNMQALQTGAADEDVVWISIISSAPGAQGHVDADKANALTESRGAAPAHVILDPNGEIGRLYAAASTPHMYVVAPGGALAYKGAIDSIPSANPADISKATNYVTSALAALKAGETPDPASTRAYGCSVKYGS